MKLGCDKSDKRSGRRAKAQELNQIYAFIGERVAEAKVRHLDETWFRIVGKLQCLHTTSSLSLTFYRAGEKRGAIPENLPEAARVQS